MLKEFKEFAMKGSLIDMAIGIVIGAAFGAVTNSFINGIFMPIIGLIFQVGDLSKAKLVLKEAVVATDGSITTPESAIMYGEFIGYVINFLIVAWIMFLLIKGMNKMKRAQEEAPAAPAAPPASEVLLAEIRDLLKK